MLAEAGVSLQVSGAWWCQNRCSSWCRCLLLVCCKCGQLLHHHLMVSAKEVNEETKSDPQKTLRNSSKKSCFMTFRTWHWKELFERVSVIGWKLVSTVLSLWLWLVGFHVSCWLVVEVDPPLAAYCWERHINLSSGQICPATPCWWPLTTVFI